MGTAGGGCLCADEEPPRVSSYASVLWEGAAKIDMYVLTDQHVGLWLSYSGETEREILNVDCSR